MAEKISITWNDFIENTTESFGLLRKEEDFFDVTLVSDDQKQLSAHKLILSACSGFFKSVLKNNPHSHPLLYLNGVSSSNLSLILDYIYNGVVQMGEDKIQSFMNVAQKLGLKGLQVEPKKERVLSNEKSKFNVLDFLDEKSKSVQEDVKNKMIDNDSDDDGNELNISLSEELEEVIDEEELCIKSGTKKFKMLYSDLEEIDKMVVKDGNTYKCGVCGRNSRDRSNVRRHVETHVDGLAYPCEYCPKSLKTKNAHYMHIIRNHSEARDSSKNKSDV